MECLIFFFLFLQQKIHVVISAVFKTKQSPGWGPGITSRSVAATIIMERKSALVCEFDLSTELEDN